MTQNFITILLALSLSFAASPAYAAAGKSSSEFDDPLARKITGAANYVPFFGIRAAITSDFHVAGLVAVDAGLEIPDDRVLKRVVARRSRLNDAMRVALADYAHRTHISGEAPDAHMIKRRLQIAVDRELGRDEAFVTLASLILFDE